ncbi:hypothetical protein CPS_2414 [Colwellia psychrerythraea 34H]|uniref:Uncharacterized protein n=1 Tax=Colwellia psychrerythraea (strain 34H / ATCC BAA-681) TaxID=167879 RepID=Q481Y8_COLP3|nr:hypothetical protein CPS_2414 [Colwellia psychrerythraea 34H]
MHKISAHTRLIPHTILKKAANRKISGFLLSSI